MAGGKLGRPSIKTPELLAEILDRVKNGESVKAISKDPAMPAFASIYTWVNADPEFAKALAEARAIEAHHAVDDLALLEESVLAGKIDAAAFRAVTYSRHWRASKFNRRAYGDYTTIAGDSDNPIQVSLADAIVGARKRANPVE